MRDTRLSAYKRTHVAPRSSYSRIPTFVRTNSRRACAEAALRAADILVRPGEATVILAYRSGRLSVARDRFEVLGVRGDINKSTTFGTEDKCNPLEATIGAALRYQTLRSVTATEIGAGTVNVAKMVVVESEYATESAFKFEHAEASNSSEPCCRELCAPT